MRIGPVVEITTSLPTLQIRNWNSNESVNQDNSHSWSEFLMELSNLWSILLRTTENVADPQEEEYVPTSSGVVVAKSKAKAQHQPRESTGGTTIPLSERLWIDIETSSKISIRTISGRKSFFFIDTIRRYSEKKMEQLNSAKKNSSSQSSFTMTELVWWSMENMFGCKRRIQTKMSVMLYQFWNNSLLPCSSRLEARSQRNWIYWLLCITSCAIHAQCMEETPRRDILGRYWFCDQRRISVLSNTIECHHSSRNTSSPLCLKSWKIEKWRGVAWKTTFVSSTTIEDLFETRSRLDQRKWSIGLIEHRPVGKLVQQVTWRNTLRWISQPTFSKPNPIGDRTG